MRGTSLAESTNGNLTPGFVTNWMTFTTSWKYYAPPQQIYSDILLRLTAYAQIQLEISFSTRCEKPSDLLLFRPIFAGNLVTLLQQPAEVIATLSTFTPAIFELLEQPPTPFWRLASARVLPSQQYTPLPKLDCFMTWRKTLAATTDKERSMQKKWQHFGQLTLNVRRIIFIINYLDISRSSTKSTSDNRPRSLLS